MGSTIPLVPKMEIPPKIPSLGLKVFSACSFPPGTETESLIHPENRIPGRLFLPDEKSWIWEPD